MARKYTRDNRGRFASGGGGATARGGRLKTASGAKRDTQTIKASAGLRSTLAKPKGLKPGAIKPKQSSKPASKPKFEKIPQGAGRRTAALSGGRRLNISTDGKTFSASLIGKDGAPRMERRGLRNVTAAKGWAASPNARGPRLLGGGLKTEASPKATWTRNARSASTIGKPKGLKPGAIQARAAAKPAAKSAGKPFSKVQFDHAAFMRRSIRRDTAPGIREAYATQGGRKPTALEAKKIDRAKQTSARARKFDSTPTRDRVVRSTAPKAAKPAAKPAAKAGAKGGKVDEAKALRIAGRLSNLDARTKGRSSADRIRSLNTVSVRVKAVGFLRGKAKPGQETPASVAKRLNTRPRYSTGAENRNKPGAYNDYGQAKMRAQRAERMKSKFDNESIQRRISRVNQRSRARGGIDTQASAKAREVYQAQLSGRSPRGRGAQLPPRIAGEATAKKRANMIKRAKAGKPVGGASVQIRSDAKRSVISSAAAATGATRRAAARKAKRVKANAFQRSEAAYAKRQFGVRSTIKNPGRRSMNLPKQTSASGARITVSGRTRKQAAAAQASRRNRFLDANRVKTQGTFKRSVNRQPNLLTGRVDRVGAGKFRPVAKRRR